MYRNIISRAEYTYTLLVLGVTQRVSFIYRFRLLGVLRIRITREPNPSFYEEGVNYSFYFRNLYYISSLCETVCSPLWTVYAWLIKLFIIELT